MQTVCKIWQHIMYPSAFESMGENLSCFLCPVSKRCGVLVVKDWNAFFVIFFSHLSSFSFYCALTSLLFWGEQWLSVSFFITLRLDVLRRFGLRILYFLRIRKENMVALRSTSFKCPPADRWLSDLDVFVFSLVSVRLKVCQICLSCFW